MQELRFVAVSEDGRYAVLAVPGRSARFTLPIDERLRAVALGQTSRLAQYEIEVESPLRPKEIQARIRAGETVEEIADAAGIAVERVRWFEGPVLAERAYIADQAQAASVRRPGESTPGPRLGEISAERLTAVGADPDDVQWDARKRGDGNWQVLLTFTSGGRLHVAEWMFDPRRRHVIPVDDNAARMSLPDVELPAAPVPSHGQATVTRLEPRVRHEPPAPVHAAPAHSGSGYSGAGHSGAGHSGAGHSAPARPEPQPAVSRPESIPQAEPVRAEAAQPVAVPFTPAPAVTMVPPAAPPAPAPVVTPPAPTPVVTPAAVAVSATATTAGQAPVAAHVEESPAAEAPAAVVAERVGERVAQPAAPEPVVQPAAPEPVAQPAASVVAEPVAQPAAPVAAEPAAEPVAQPAAIAERATEPPAAQPAAVVQPAAAAEPTTVVTEPAAVVAEPAAAADKPAVIIQPAEEPVVQPAAIAEPAAVNEPTVQPAVAQPAAVAEPAVQVAAREPAADSEPQHDSQSAAASKAAEQASRPGRKAARGRRSSVPSWDEIMLGSSRQQD